MSSGLIARLSSFAQEAATRLRVRSALNPALWFCGIVFPISLIVAYLSSGMVQIVALIFAAIPILVVATGFLYFMKNDPDKLQSESFQLSKQTLELIEESGSPIPVAITSVEAISNPERARLLLREPADDDGGQAG